MIRKHIIAHGRVQGVGFRYICASFAANYHVTGWVRNLYDGTVEIEVQGAEHRVNLFIEDVKRGNRFARVEHLDIWDMEPLRALEEKGFRVKY